MVPRSRALKHSMGVLPVAAAAMLGSAHVGFAAEPPPGDDGQVMVVPGDISGRFAPPSVDMEALEKRGHAPIRPGRAPVAGSVPQQDDVAGTYAAAGEPSAIPPGCAVGAFGVGGVSGTGAPSGNAYGIRCLDPVPDDEASPDAAGAAAAPSPAELAARAFEQMRLPLPVPEHSPDVRLPDGRDAVVVGEHTWIWTDPDVWQPVVERVQVGAVWAEVTAVPVGMTIDSGTGGSTSCSGPGTPYDRSYGLHTPSPDCGFVYTRSSLGQPNDHVTAEWAIRWVVTWVGSDGSTDLGGDFPEMSSRATASFVVAEVQALRAN
ncbi:hypothetical protein SAMN05421630_110198 [Prauserella marina]|uniref:Uncharacterized protein n=1 Tax=Prauserella marina TaxID=530584 RepID=A0A1G6W5K1_9PSEU|nr:hypothetical protein DES30_108197 [Prauserella marina]SDD61131.1 hypothetical protein SAMN05421630_110198 [Prauserella marina]